MNFFKKLFGANKAAANSVRIEDLENAVKPLLKPAVAIVVGEAKQEPSNAQMLSHFGGKPYFEAGESWPYDESGTLDFVLQVYNDGRMGLPDDVLLIQFFYNFEESPWESDNDGWLIKTYPSPSAAKAVTVARPITERQKYCEIRFEEVMTVPDWESLSDTHPEIETIAEMVHPEGWESYETVTERLTGPQASQSRFGGYPYWIQGDETPLADDGTPLRLLMQIDSEDNAGVMWGDAGIVYLFYDPATKQFQFLMQCH